MELPFNGDPDVLKRVYDRVMMELNFHSPEHMVDEIIHTQSSTIQLHEQLAIIETEMREVQNSINAFK